MFLSVANDDKCRSTDINTHQDALLGKKKEAKKNSLEKGKQLWENSNRVG